MSANRQIAKNMLFNLGVFIINTGISFFLSPYLIKTVGKEAYSFYPLVSNIVQYSNIITAAIGSMAGRFITMEIYGNRIKEAEGYFNSVLLANWLLSLFFGLLTLIGVIYIADILTVPDHLILDVRWLFALSAIATIITINSDLLGIGTYIKNRIDLNSMMRMAWALVNVIVIISLFLTCKSSIIYIGIASLIASIICIGFNISFKRKLLPELSITPFSTFSFEKIKILVSSGIWNSINQLSNVLLTHIDLLITNIFIGAAATGDFALVKMAPNLIYTLLALLTGSFIPNFNILYAKKQYDELLHEVKKSIKVVGVLICIPLGFLLVFADDFFSLWVPTSNSNYLHWLSFATVLPMVFGSSVNPVFGVFTITNRLKIPSIVLLLCGIINTIVICVLLKTTNLGIWSIPIVSGIQHVLRNFFFTPMYAASCLKQKLGVFYPAVYRCCLALFIVCISGYCVKMIIPENSWLLLATKALAMTFVSLLLNVYIIFNSQERNYLLTRIKGLTNKLNIR